MKRILGDTLTEATSPQLRARVAQDAISYMDDNYKLYSLLHISAMYHCAAVVPTIDTKRTLCKSKSVMLH